MKSLFIILVLSAVVYSQIGSIIPSDRRVDWRNAGLGIAVPGSVTRFVSVMDYGAKGDGVNNDTQPVLNAIKAASSNTSGFSMVYFPAGNYYITSPLNIPSNIVLKGSGSDKTKISFLMNHDLSAINFVGSSESNFISVTGGYAKGSKTITLQTPLASVNPGDFIELIMSNGNWKQNVYTTYNPQDYTGQIERVESVNGANIAVRDELSIAYSNNPRVRKLLPVVNSGIEDLQIFRISNGKGSGSNIIMNAAVNCWLKGVESNNTCRYHMEISRSSFIDIRGCYFHHAEDYGDGGYGYGIAVNLHSTNCLVENNVFQRLRHSMLLQLGANRNVFGFNYSREEHATYIVSGYEVNTTLGDACVHAHYPYTNLYEGNIVETISVDDYWGDNGPYNTFFRNRVTRNDNLVQMGGIHIQANNQNIIGNVLADIDDQFYYTSQYSGNLNNYNGSPGSTGDAPCPDISYYYTTQPAFLQGYTWPPVGTRTSYSTLSQSIPALDRWNSGGIKTSPGASLSQWKISAETPLCYLPYSGQTNVQPDVKFTWSKVTGAKKYTLQISKNSAFTNIVFIDSLITDTSKSVPALEGSTNYYWRVKARNDYGEGEFSMPVSFTTASVTACTLNGYVYYYNASGSPVKNVNIIIQAGKTYNAVTDNSGFFEIKNITPGSYILNAYKNGDWGGVTSADALLVARQYVQTGTLVSIQLCAGDVNNNGSINSADALLIQQRYVGLINSYINNKPDWVFKIAQNDGTIQVDDARACVSDTVSINSSVKTIIIRTLCTGDVNGSLQK